MRKKNVGTIELPKEIITSHLINATNIRNVSKKKRSLEANAYIK